VIGDVFDSRSQQDHPRRLSTVIFSEGGGWL
jgi:hypothetical protein